MKYSNYWSILDTPSNSLKSEQVILFAFIVFVLVWVLIKKFKKNNRDLEKSILLWTIGLVSIIFFSMFIYLKLFFIDDTNERLTKFLESERVAKVEGLISNFSRRREIKKYTTITFESFLVDSITFSYDDYLLGQFNKFGKTNNGIFKNGLPVRVTYLKSDTSIQKIEIIEE